MTLPQVCDPYPIPLNERERLAALYGFGIPDTGLESSFERIAAMAARLFEAPIALVSLVDSQRQWFKAQSGFDAVETAREFSCCAHAMLDREPMVICDATQDIRFQSNPLVTGEMSVKFYAGAPLRTRDGLPLGSLCVIDKAARERPAQHLLDSLADLAFLVVEQLEFRSDAVKTSAGAGRRYAEDRYSLFAETALDLFLIVDEQGTIVTANRAAKPLLGYEPDELAGQALSAVVPACPLSAGTITLELRAVHKSGKTVPVEVSFGHFYREERMFTAILRDITDRKKAEVALERAAQENRRALLEKDTLLHEIHHRVKNNLQIVSSLLKLQGDLLTDPSAVAALKESRQRVLSMSMIHERLYAGEQMAEIEFDDYARVLVQELVRSYAGGTGNVTGRILPPQIRLNIGQAIPCGLILNELVTNALKYAYPDGRDGEVTVELHESPEGRIRLAVSDQGQGLPPGFDRQHAKSLGLRIVDVLAKQLNGTLTIDSGQERTTFTLDFPREDLKSQKRSG